MRVEGRSFAGWIYRCVIGLFALANAISIVSLLAPVGDKAQPQGVLSGLGALTDGFTSLVFPAALDGVLFFAFLMVHLRPEWAALALLALTAPMLGLLILGLKHGAKVRLSIILLAIMLSVGAHLFSAWAFRPLLDAFLKVGQGT